MHWSSENPDTFQDSILASVKELFEDCEAELLPTQKQLKRYKKRNLQASHVNRISRKVFGSRQTLFRHHHIENDPIDSFVSQQNFQPDLKCHVETVPPFDNTTTVFGNTAKLSSSDVLSDPNENLSITEWVEQRKKLRNDLDNMGMNSSWLERKPSKTCLEESVLAQLQKENNKKSMPLSDEFSSRNKSVLLTMNKIAQVISKNEFLSNLFKSKSDLMTWQKCKEALQQVQKLGNINDEAINSVMNFYFGKKSESELFHKELSKALRRNKGPNPMITVTSAEDRLENVSRSIPVSEESKKENEVKTAFKAMAEQKNSRIRTLNAVREKFKSEDLPFNESTFENVFLHPDDVQQRNVKSIRGQSSCNLLSEDFWKVRERKRSRRRRRRENSTPESQETDDEKLKQILPSESVIFLPSSRDVAPEHHHMNLSTGRALVGRKVDCWLSAEEYMQITGENNSLPLIRDRPNPNAFWPGHLIDRTRLWMPPCLTHPYPPCDKVRDKNSIFQPIRVRPLNGKRTNIGYNNNELTWPTDGLYVKFGDIEMHKRYQL